MPKYIEMIEDFWQDKETLSRNIKKSYQAREILENLIQDLGNGIIRVSNKIDGKWVVDQRIKKAILLYMMLTESNVYSSGCINWYDKIPPKFDNSHSKSQFLETAARIVPGAYIRAGAYLAKNIVVMPSFINIGAYIDEGSMIDTWATVGSCAQIGKNCHISGGTGIGGVLEPIQSNPVIIEDNCFIGARSEIAEGVIVEEGSVISMGVFIGASTKIVYRDTGEVIYGKVPAYSVVVPGATESLPGKPSLYCAVIIKQVDESTRRKTSINELLR